MKQEKLHIIDAASVLGTFEAELRWAVNEKIALIKMQKEGIEAMKAIVECLEPIVNHPFIKHYQGIKTAFEDVKPSQSD